MAKRTPNSDTPPVSKFDFLPTYKNFDQIKLRNIFDPDNFWCLFDELHDDKSEFLNNRSTILSAYREGNLYGLKVEEEKQGMFFSYRHTSLLPCFCIRQDNKAMLIWTHTRARKRGFAKKLVDLLHIEYAYEPLPDSLKFWEKCNIKCFYEE